MTAVLILVVGIVLLGLGYIVYGSWLAKKWGVNPDRPTPAHTKFDNKDFVPANPAVLMGHHFSSIAGAGPINGPIQAAVFGWLPVFLWVVIGGIFFGALHDFGAPRLRVRPGGGLPLSAQADPAYPATADGAIHRKKYLTETFNCQTSGNSG